MCTELLDLIYSKENITELSITTTQVLMSEVGYYKEMTMMVRPITYNVDEFVLVSRHDFFYKSVNPGFIPADSNAANDLEWSIEQSEHTS